MKQFWQKEKYQVRKEPSKALYIREIETKALISSQNVMALPSFSSISSIFKDVRIGLISTLEEMKKSIIEGIEHKTSRRRKHQWEYQNFAQKLAARVKEFDKPEELQYWIGVFEEYYKLLKSENKNA